MKKKFLAFLLVVLIFTLSCLFVPRPTSENGPPSPTDEPLSPILPNPSKEIEDEVNKEEVDCNPENWKMTVLSVDEIDRGEEGKKLAVVRIGFENNSSFWGSIDGPPIFDSNQQYTSNIVLTTNGGLTYQPIRSQIPLQPESSSDQNQYESTGWLDTKLMPPDFVSKGKVYSGIPNSFNYAFIIPNSEIPKSITIRGVRARCIRPATLNESGQYISDTMRANLPDVTYELNRDIAETHNMPSTNNYPNLVGIRIELPVYDGYLEFTKVTRDGNIVNVIFNYTNLAQYAMSPPFDGYVTSGLLAKFCNELIQECC